MFLTRMDDLITGRLVGTAILTAVAAALMLPASNMAGNKKSAYAGAVSMALIVAEFLIILIGMWDIDLRGDFSDNMYETAALVALVAVPTVLTLRFMGRPDTKIAGPVGLILFPISLIAFLVAVWYPSPRYSWDDWPLWRTAWWIYLLSPLIVAATVGMEIKRPLTIWRMIGVVAACTAFVLTFCGVFDDAAGNSVYYRHLESDFVLAVSVAVVVALASLSLLVPLKSNQVGLRWGSIIFAGVAGLAATISWRYPPNYHYGVSHNNAAEVWERVATGCGILAGCGTIAMAVLARLNRMYRDGRDPQQKLEVREITIICPVCTKKSTLAIGASSCPGCKLRLTISAEEPRCVTCGYSLLLCESDKCPECGTAAGTVAMA